MDHAITPIAKRSSGCLLLSFERNAIFSLNDSAHLIWNELEDNSQGLTREQLARSVLNQFGESAPGNQVINDVNSLVARLVEAGFLTIDSRELLRIKPGVFRSAEVDIKEVKDVGVSGETEVSKNRTKSIVDDSAAFVALIAFEVVKLLFGFRRLMSFVKRLPVAKGQDQPARRTREICDSLNRAKLWYPKQIHCLQHSAVVTCLLKLHGIPATMMIGATQRPFYAHAWSEVYGTVVNDSQSVRDKYAPFVAAGR